MGRQALPVALLQLLIKFRGGFARYLEIADENKGDLSIRTNGRTLLQRGVVL